MGREFIARSTRMPHFPARLSTSASSHHDLSLAGFITNIAESDFRDTQRVAATVGPLVVGFALPRYGISGVFLIFSIFALTGGIAAIFMDETSGRVLEEVSP
jgi:hypothetical protein